jgi:hypothetical protein
MQPGATIPNEIRRQGAKQSRESHHEDTKNTKTHEERPEIWVRRSCFDIS